VIGLAYADMIWGFANVTISTNLARDLGTRIVAAIFFGGDAFNRYAPIAILVNIPATIFATTYYELVLRDSIQRIAQGHGQHEEGEEGLARHLTKVGTLEEDEAGGRRVEQGMAGNVIRYDQDQNGSANGCANGRKETNIV
jgi:hypothetical protein